MSLPTSVIAEREPEKMHAAISAQWRKSLSDFPATAWQLSYTLVTPANASLAIAWSTHVSADGSDFVVNVPGAFLTWTAGGSGRLIGKVTSTSVAADTAIIYEGTLQCVVLGERSLAQRMLTAIDAMLLGNASREEQSVQVSFPGGTSKALQLCSKTELIEFRGYWQGVRNAELAAENAAAGRPSRRLIRNRYSRV